jgi:hypothetical protein
MSGFEVSGVYEVYIDTSFKKLNNVKSCISCINFKLSQPFHLGIGSSPLQMKYVLSILWSRFKADAFNGVLCT